MCACVDWGGVCLCMCACMRACVCLSVCTPLLKTIDLYLFNENIKYSMSRYFCKQDIFTQTFASSSIFTATSTQTFASSSIFTATSTQTSTSYTSVTTHYVTRTSQSSSHAEVHVPVTRLITRLQVNFVNNEAFAKLQQQ